MKSYQYAAIYWNDQWLKDACIKVDSNGLIHSLETNCPGGRDYLIPGVSNCHSHSFQYAFSGLTEYCNVDQLSDSFWSWRDTMYHIANKITAEQILATATKLYCEMLENGYTSVCEFHYLHHQESGKPYDDDIKISLLLSEAAKKAGISFCLLPVFYNKGGFEQEIQPSQRRFYTKSLQRYFELIKSLESALPDEDTLGIALHSLRASSLEDAKTLLQTNINGPIHIHISEQTREVEEFKKLYDVRPVQWLLDNVQDTKPLSLVHSTHIDSNELRLLADSPHCVVICPSTEANLGDGLFPIKEFEALGGTWCIGSDSHIKVNPFQEFELLDYGQRLKHHLRNPLVHDNLNNSGELLFKQSQIGSVIASNRRSKLDIGAPFTGIELDGNHSAYFHKQIDHIFSTAIFCNRQDMIKSVYVSGERLVKDGHHIRRKDIDAEYKNHIERLFRDRFDR